MIRSARASAAALLLAALAAGAAHAAPPESVVGVTASTTTGLRTSIALDDENTIHISYFDPTDAHVKYIRRRNGGLWSSTQTVGAANHSHSTHTAMALDSSNTPHVVFYDQDDLELKYTFLRGGSWETPSVIELFAATAPYVAIAIGSDDEPRVLYNQSESTSTKLGVFDGVAWSTFTVNFSSMVSPGAIAVDSADRVHVAINLYVDSFDVAGSSQHVVAYGRGSGPAYNFSGTGLPVGPQFVTGMTTEPGSVSLVLDSNGAAHIAAFGEEDENLWYMTGTPSGLTLSTVTTVGRVGRDNAITVDSSDRAMIAFLDEGDRLALAECTTTTQPCGWNLSTLDPDDSAGAGVDLVRNPFNSVFASYFDGVAPELRFVTDSNTGLAISGDVLDFKGDPLSGVRLTLSGAIASTSAVTAAAGTYSFSSLLEGIYLVTPSFTGYAFEPGFRSFALRSSAGSQDFSGGPVGFEQLDNVIDPTRGQSVTMTASVLTGHLFIGVYTLNGRLVKALMDEHKPIGSYTVTWDGRNENGEIVASGIYLVRVNGKSVKTVEKVAVIK